MDANPGAEEEDAEVQEPNSSLFPLHSVANPSQSSHFTPTSSQWLLNSSFTADLSLIDDAIRSDRLHYQDEVEQVDVSPRVQHEVRSSQSFYEFLESSGSERGYEKETKKKKKKKRKLRSGKGVDDLSSRKSSTQAWADSDSKSSKDYYFDSRGDRDNLAFGCSYRMDVARYKNFNVGKVPTFDYKWNQRGLMLERDGDIDLLNNKEKSGSRYWSAKYAAVERHKNFKRVRIHVPRNPSDVVTDDFISIVDFQPSNEVEESWEDKVLRKTREFNKLTREHPHDEKAWLDFAEFQDKVADMQAQKGARLQTLEKKISILEKAAELNPYNEEILLHLLKAYQRRDSIDSLIGKWEKILMQHSGSYKLWREFLCVVQGEFSRFKVSDLRQMYVHAIQALSAECGKQIRQVHYTTETSLPSNVVQLELGLVDIFLCLCSFEWQSGYQELATALFQAEIEFSLFSPSLQLNEHSKRRLFEHFWSSNGARIGEEGAIGWSSWLEKEEENRQNILQEEQNEDDEKGGWTGWSERPSVHITGPEDLETAAETEIEAEDLELRNENTKQEDDTEALLKMLGIDVEVDPSDELKDTSTWARWCEEETLRDSQQWMPVRGKIEGKIHDGEGTPEREADEQIFRDILFEDVKENLFSLSSKEARLSLVFQFIEFFGGKVSQSICSNSSTFMEKMLSSEQLPDSLRLNLKAIHDVLHKSESSSDNIILEFLLGSVNDRCRKPMMKFIRNAALLCLTAFQRNYILEEAALIAEELSAMEVDSLGSSVTPCRVLAKQLLKHDRQDVLLCGVYARREAAYGNIDLARRVFDMALQSVEGLPLGQKAHLPILYFWYAEVELAADLGKKLEPYRRAIHILSCLGSGIAYEPFKSESSRVQLLKAHLGFREKVKALHSGWFRGDIEDSSIALMCSAALFEELTSGCSAGAEVFDQAFAMVLPERRKHSHQLEYLFNYYMKMLMAHHRELSNSKLQELITQGLRIYPFSPELYNALAEFSHNYFGPSKLRLRLDEYLMRQPSVVLWIFTLSFEMMSGGSRHRIHGLFERSLADEKFRHSVVLWRLYITYEISIAQDLSSAKRIFFRAIHACPWSKKMWLDGFVKLKSILSPKELSDLQEVMRDKEINLRTDIYEILLQDEVAT